MFFQGEVYTWGSNDKGQLGAHGGPQAGAWAGPRRMELLYGWDVRGISCGSKHTVAMTMTDVITWGSNERGQCGHGERAERDWVKPRSLKILSGQMVTQVVCGQDHTLCVTATSVVYAWGANHRGQLGLGDTTDRRSPTVVTALWALPVLQLAAGDLHSAALTSNGFLFMWGANEQGQLGLPAAADQLGERTASERRRIIPRINQRFLQAMGEMGIPREQAELALAETGNVGVEVATEWLFSLPADVLENRLSGVGVDTPTSSLDAVVGGADAGDSSCVSVPRRVPLQGVRAMAMGAAHTVVATDEEVYAWGDNSYGQLGLRSLASMSMPTEVQDLRNAGVCQLAAGARHTLFLCRDGTAYGCGDASNGALYLEDPDPTICIAGLSLLSGSDESCPIAPESEWVGGTKKQMVTSSIEFTQSNQSESSFASAHTLGESTVSLDLLEKSVGLQQQYSSQAPASNSMMDSNDEYNVHMLSKCYVTAPTPLRLDFLKSKKPGVAVLTHVEAGPRCSAFLTRAGEELPESPVPRLWERLQEAIRDAKEAPLFDIDVHVRPIASAVERIFSSAAAISAAFGTADAVGIDAILLDSMQSSILELEPPPATKLGDPQPERNDLHRALRAASDALILDLEANVRLLGTPERAQVLLAALQSPLMGDSRCANSLIPRLCNIILAAPMSCRHLLVRWWADYPGALLEARVVRPLQRYLTDELYATKKLTVAVMNAIRTLAYVEEANQLGRSLPPEAFYNELISEKLDVLDHYVAWRQTHDMPQHTSSADGPFSFCSYPFLLNPRAKSKLLHTEARIQMDQTVADARAAHHAGRPEEEERVVANSKPHAKERKHTDGAAHPTRRDQPSASAHPPRRRRGSGGGLRWLFRHASIEPDSPALESGSLEAGLLYIGEEGSTPRRPSSPGGAFSTPKEPGLTRQGSFGLPRPEISGFPATHPDMCILRVRRGHLLEDALDEVARQRPRDLFKPLRVHFIGEDGVDGGGVKKEFFQLLMTELLCPDYGMLAHQPESNTYWFDPATLEADDEFLLLGLVIGLAVYNGVLLDLPLPLALYRKILGQEVRLRDLEEMQPTLGRSLRQLLQYEGPNPVADVFCQTFSLDITACGEAQTVPLCPGGETTVVTEDNRREFVELYVDWWLNRSIERQFEAFAKGFLMLCGGPALQLFSATELERLVCGSPCLDFDALVSSARYEGGYHPEHRVVQWLWQVVAGLNADEKKLFLKFFTGSDRAPIGGLANLRIVIQRDGADSTKLPTSHTCFNTLLLPSYRSKEKLEDRLKLAILNAEGFGLE